MLISEQVNWISVDKTRTRWLDRPQMMINLWWLSAAVAGFLRSPLHGFERPPRGVYIYCLTLSASVHVIRLAPISFLPTSCMMHHSISWLRRNSTCAVVYELKQANSSHACWNLIPTSQPCPPPPPLLGPTHESRPPRRHGSSNARRRSRDYMSLALQIGDPSPEDLRNLISAFAAQPRYGLLPPPSCRSQRCSSSGVSWFGLPRLSSF